MVLVDSMSVTDSYLFQYAERGYSSPSDSESSEEVRFVLLSYPSFHFLLDLCHTYCGERQRSATPHPLQGSWRVLRAGEARALPVVSNQEPHTGDPSLPVTDQTPSK